jgi:ATP-binding cassette, sub-family E, member 1
MEDKHRIAIVNP